MHSFNAGFTRKLKRGRPCEFKIAERSYIVQKKEALFENNSLGKEQMNMICLSYNFGKLTKEEYDIACFLEHISIKAHKGLGIKKLPTSSPNTWKVHIQNSWHIIASGYENTKAQDSWRSIKEYVAAANPKIAKEFFNIITAHYSYEDLQAVKINTFSITDILKEGLKIVSRMFDLGYI